jgi:hypothetical protein
MDFKELATTLRTAADELERLSDALATLQGSTAGKKSKGKGKRTLSAKARKAIGDAQRKRWAKVRKAE